MIPEGFSYNPNQFPPEMLIDLAIFFTKRVTPDILDLWSSENDIADYCAHRTEEKKRHEGMTLPNYCLDACKFMTHSSGAQTTKTRIAPDQVLVANSESRFVVSTGN